MSPRCMKMHVSRFEAVVAAIGASNDGIVTTAAQEAAGVPLSMTESLRRRGVLVKLGRGVDRLRDHPLTWRARCRATLELAGDGAALALGSSARLHGFYSYRHVEQVDVVVVRGRDQRTPLGRITQTRWLPRDHVTLVEGLPSTTVARTFFDLCGHPPGRLKVDHPAHERAMTRVYNDALARRGLTFTQEAAVLLVLAKRGRAGTQLVRQLLTKYGPKYKPTHSDTETLFLLVLEAYNLPEPEKQVAMVDDGGFIGIVDFTWRNSRVIAEVDSSWHDGPLDEEVDDERDRRLRALGYDVHRYRYGDIVTRPGRIARKLGVAVSRGG